MNIHKHCTMAISNKARVLFFKPMKSCSKICVLRLNFSKKILKKYFRKGIYIMETKLSEQSTEPTN